VITGRRQEDEAKMKFASKGVQPESKIVSKLKNITDTNLGHVDFQKFKGRMYRQDGPLPTHIAHRMMRNEIVQAARFPPTMECAELMVECARHYDAQERQIVALDERVLAHLGEVAIQEAFGIPNYVRTSYKTKEDTKKLYDDQYELCTTNVNKSWLVKPMPSIKKMPKKLLRTDFKKEYGDIILLLNRVASSPQSAPFKSWMYCFIDEINSRVKMFNWSRMISNNLDEQLRNLESTKTFYMSYYIIYLLARSYKCSGLICKGMVETGEGELRSYDYYPQLQLSEKSHFKRVNNAF
jgi:hypothetical protein